MDNPSAIFVLTLLFGLLLSAAGWALFMPSKREKEHHELKLSEWTCPKCGRTNVPAGAEKYHYDRCYGRREQRNMKIGHGRPFER